MKLKPCPKCGCPDELYMDSSSAAEASWIECHNCEHRMQAKCDEETLAERWNKFGRKSMPAFSSFEPPAEQTTSTPRSGVYRALDYWYGRAKKAEAALLGMTANA